MPGPYFPDPVASKFNSAAFVANEDGNVIEMLKALLSGGGRVHVGMLNWHQQPGTDFWIMDWHVGSDVAIATNHGLIALSGTTITAASVVPGAGGTLDEGDLLSEADPGFGSQLQLDTAADRMVTSPIFGGLAHRVGYEALTGSVPTRLCAEWWSRWTAHAANEVSSAWGFAPATGAGVFDAQGPKVYSNGTNNIFSIGGATLTGAAPDTSIHKHKIVMDNVAAESEWFVDDVSVGTIGNVANDNWPAALRFACQAGGTNFSIIHAPVHIWYEHDD